MSDRKVGPNRGNAGKGRPKGSRNRTTVAMKDAIMRAFAEVGGESYLVQVAHDDPKTFCGLLGKVLPIEVQGDGGGPVQVIVRTGIDRGGAG